MPPLSFARVIMGLGAVTAALMALDTSVAALGASAIVREMISTGILTLSLALWPAWFPAALTLLIPSSKRLEDPVAQQRVSRIMGSFETRRMDTAEPQIILFRSNKPIGLAAGAPQRSVITLSSGLLEQLDDREVRGTLAHECGHVVGHHMMLTAGFLATLCFGKTLFGALGLPLTLALLVVYLSIVRRNEFDADRRGAQMVGAADMRRALVKFQQLRREPGWMDWPWLTILSTHPGFGRRVKALDGLVDGDGTGSARFFRTKSASSSDPDQPPIPIGRRAETSAAAEPNDPSR